MIKKYQKNIDVICFFSIIFAAIGYVVENVARLLAIGIIDNRFHVLPFIGVYGIIPIAFAIIGNPNSIGFFNYKVFKKESKGNVILSNIIYIFLIAFFVCFGEIIVGTLYEKIAGVKLWDYSMKWLHITDYTCIESIVGFSLGAFIIAKFIFFPSYDYMVKNCKKSDVVSFRYIYLVLIADMCFMMVKTVVTGQKPIYYQFSITNDIQKIIGIFVFLFGYVIVLSLFLLLVSKLSSGIGKRCAKVKNEYINDFAILIPARDESKVIESTLNAISKSDYPKDKFHVYVMVSSKDDPTIDICKGYDFVNCYIKEKDGQGKGAVLNEMLQKIEAKHDVYCILDADNIVENTFISCMNESFNEETEVVVGCRNNKNWNSNVVSAASGLTFNFINLMNQSKNKIGESVLITGTGFAIKRSLIEKMDGWPFLTMTEDYEFSCYLKKNDIKSVYSSEAVFYDEQPLKMADSIKQRTRWINGFMTNSKSGFSNPRSVFSFGLVISYLVLLVVMAVFGILSAFNMNFVLAWKVFICMLMLAYSIIVAASFVLFFTDKRKKNINTSTIIATSLFHPIFLSTYLISFVRTFNKKNNKWDKISHSLGGIE